MSTRNAQKRTQTWFSRKFFFFFFLGIPPLTTEIRSQITTLLIFHTNTTVIFLSGIWRTTFSP